MKVQQVKFNRIGSHRLFYITENETVHSVIANIYTPSSGVNDVVLKYLESGIYALDFVFKIRGKYAFIIFEDGLKTLVLIVTIE